MAIALTLLGGLPFVSNTKNTACSSDGLVGNDGLLEIKSLKIFHDNTIHQAVNDMDRVLVSKDTLNRECFVIKDNKCIFKKSHDHY